jgi:hypothetical protein
MYSTKNRYESKTQGIAIVPYLLSPPPLPPLHLTVSHKLPCCVLVEIIHFARRHHRDADMPIRSRSTTVRSASAVSCCIHAGVARRVDLLHQCGDLVRGCTSSPTARAIATAATSPIRVDAICLQASVASPTRTLSTCRLASSAATWQDSSVHSRGYRSNNIPPSTPLMD